MKLNKTDLNCILRALKEFLKDKQYNTYPYYQELYENVLIEISLKRSNYYVINKKEKLNAN